MAKRVFSLETERDKDLYVLSATLATCKRKKLEDGECCNRNCRECHVMKHLVTCFRELPACDRLRVEGQSEELFDRLLMEHPTPDMWEARRRSRRQEDVKMVVASITPWAILALLLFYFMNGCSFAL